MLKCERKRPVGGCRRGVVGRGWVAVKNPQGSWDLVNPLVNRGWVCFQLFICSTLPEARNWDS